MSKIIDLEDKEQEIMLLVEQAALFSSINHDINNHLTTLSLSLRRIKKSGIKYEDEKLLKVAGQIEKSLEEIEKILTKCNPLKNNALVKDFKKKNNGI
jgi:hypothetical protein